MDSIDDSWRHPPPNPRDGEADRTYDELRTEAWHTVRRLLTHSPGFLHPLAVLDLGMFFAHASLPPIQGVRFDRLRVAYQHLQRCEERLGGPGSLHARLLELAAGGVSTALSEMETDAVLRAQGAEQVLRMVAEVLLVTSTELTALFTVGELPKTD